MKQLLFIMMLLFCASGNINAQVCKISNTNDNVEVFSASLINSKQVKVVVSNDSQEISANVTVTVEVTYTDGSYSKTKTFTGKGLARPNTSTEIVIDIPENIDYSKKPKSVQVTGISGTKCLN